MALGMGHGYFVTIFGVVREIVRGLPVFRLKSFGLLGLALFLGLSAVVAQGL